MSNQVIDALFKTNAIRVAPQDTPFWYTSGTLGPFYINTHFLIKDEQTASDFLKRIETYIAEDHLTMPKRLFDDFMEVYESSETFKMITDLLTSKLSEYDFDYISGGERRDYFFSMLPAHFLGKPHLSIFKDGSSVYSTSDFEDTCDSSMVDLKGKKAIHVADLITEASSYVRAWIPAIRGLGSDINVTVAIIDRHQNGRENLMALNCDMYTFAGIDKALFDRAFDSKVINKAQYDLVMSFLEDPSKYMSDFLSSHPDFISNEIRKGGKSKDRAMLAIEKGLITLNN
ncbi:MAG TPA: orotate phosphoribosyltransferase [Saccharofermentans sp.]|jgi:orotate phosphoribosyltransferase|nr:orotate phosphoribosyltransferase [Clostridia bacterium]NLX68030.1 orotate phosphoribosyltransferase [Clostridiaceae bacterium]HOO48347.1 orotate phosphoribosyltransferase [Saccharofermentans sp.]HPE28436.1 orotate phosphoribosyltransferase [Saccharofermentans sp.]HPG64734.1 orotate phosphoribosyltransferase [Saccharofermentans sp.]